MTPWRIAAAFALTAALASTSAPKISMAKAKEIALQKAPGKIKSAELENEHGKLIYSFDIAGTKGITEVNVDAKSGAIVNVQHESAAKEAAEKKQEAKTKKQ